MNTLLLGREGVTRNSTTEHLDMFWETILSAYAQFPDLVMRSELAFESKLCEEFSETCF